MCTFIFSNASCSLVMLYKDFVLKDCFFQSRQLFCCVFLVWCREQDDDLDELSASLGHVGHVGLVIHEELSLQV
jgi:hypothetical protein